MHREKIIVFKVGSSKSGIEDAHGRICLLPAGRKKKAWEYQKEVVSQGTIQRWIILAERLSRCWKMRKRGRYRRQRLRNYESQSNVKLTVRNDNGLWKDRSGKGERRKRAQHERITELDEREGCSWRWNRGRRWKHRDESGDVRGVGEQYSDRNTAKVKMIKMKKCKRCPLLSQPHRLSHSVRPAPS